MSGVSGVSPSVSFFPTTSQAGQKGGIKSSGGNDHDADDGAGSTGAVKSPVVAPAVAAPALAAQASGTTSINKLA